MHKSFLILGLAASFLLVSLYCCCYASIQTIQKKSSCCKTKEANKKKSADCPHCKNSFNAEVTLKDVHHLKVPASDSVVTFKRDVTYVPIDVPTSIFINGPPGPQSMLPLYLQHHTLRI